MTRHGVYMQGIVSVCSSLELAQKELEKAKSEEPDDYHNFKISVITLDERIKDSEISV